MNPTVELLIRAAVFGGSIVLISNTLLSAVRTFVVPRAIPTRLSRWLFLSVRRVFDVLIRHRSSWESKDSLMALYAPVALLLLPAMWVTLVGIAFAGIYWSLGVGSVGDAIQVSGSSLLTLGFARPNGMASSLLAFVEAGLGIGLITLLLTYLPSIYHAFARREAMVAALEVRAGSPPTAWDMLIRLHRVRWTEDHGDLWSSWESWFVDVEESHGSLAALCFFRSPQPDRHWVSAAGCVLDAAAISVSTVEGPSRPQAHLSLRAGYIMLRRICDFYRIPYDTDPDPTEPISIGRDEFDAACAKLGEAGVVLKPDLDQAWRDYSGWRVNYDVPLLALAKLTMAPPTPWSGDRARMPSRPRRR